MEQLRGYASSRGWDVARFILARDLVLLLHFIVYAIRAVAIEKRRDFRTISHLNFGNPQAVLGRGLVAGGVSNPRMNPGLDEGRWNEETRVVQCLSQRRVRW